MVFDGSLERVESWELETGVMSRPSSPFLNATNFEWPMNGNGAFSKRKGRKHLFHLRLNKVRSDWVGFLMIMFKTYFHTFPWSLNQHDTIHYESEKGLRGRSRSVVLFGFAQDIANRPTPPRLTTIEKPTKTNKMKTKGFHPIVWRKSQTSRRAQNHLGKTSFFGLFLSIFVFRELFWGMWSAQWSSYTEESLVCGEYILYQYPPVLLYVLAEEEKISPRFRPIQWKMLLPQ